MNIIKLANCSWYLWTKWGKEKDALQKSNSQLDSHINDLKAFMSVLKEILIFKDTGLRLTKSKIKISSYKLLNHNKGSLEVSLSNVKVRTMVDREWDPKIWNGDMWKDLVRLGNWAPKFWWVFASRNNLPILTRSSQPTTKKEYFSFPIWGD